MDLCFCFTPMVFNDVQVHEGVCSACGGAGEVDPGFGVVLCAWLIMLICAITGSERVAVNVVF